MDTHAGFFVVTPLRLAGRADAILVQRGWAPRNQVDRSQLPPLATPAGEVEVQGRLAASPSRLFDLGEGAAGAIRQNLDPAAFAVESGLALLPLTVVQTAPSGADDGLLRHWPAPDLGLHKHYGYAFQWFALCALILVLYVWFQLIRPRLRQP
jgi:surfeit locus 1 family protein